MMRALLWKECRENLYKLLMALGVCLVILVLRQDAEFNGDFSQNIGEWVAFFGLFCAAIFGVDVVASERSRGTLGFLLAQPLTMPRILASKLVVGIAAR
jgi:ABC-type transport system involved in multi-copper enzyme maturation permease subunit